MQVNFRLGNAHKHRLEFVSKLLIDSRPFLLKLLHVYVLSLTSSNHEVHACNTSTEDLGICLDFFHIEAYQYLAYKILETNLLIERVKLSYFVFKYAT